MTVTLTSLYQGNANAGASNGGATTISSAVDITLTAASTRVQAVTMTVAAKGVTLPDATTLTTGGALYVIKNYGTITFAVRNSAGTLLAPVGAGQIIGLYLSNNSTAAGTWVVGNQSTSSFISEIWSGSTLAVNAIAADSTGICSLSATQAVLVFVTQANSLRAVTINISGTTMTAGEILTVGTGYYYASVIAMSSTQALVVSVNGNYHEAFTLNISGTTITAGAQLDFGAFVTSRALAKLSSTRAVVSYISGGNLAVRTLDISGTTITANEALVTGQACTGEIAIGVFSSTAVVVAWAETSGYLRSSCFTFGAGGYPSASNSTSNNNSSPTSYVTVAPLTSTTALLVYLVNSTIRFSVITFNGTVTSVGTEFNTGIYGGWLASTALTSNKVLVTFSGASLLQDFIITVDSGAAGSPLIANSLAGYYNSVACLSSGMSLFAFKNSSTGFTNVTLLETAL